MPRKRTKTRKATAKPKRKRAAVIPSVTAKTQTKQLRKALSRHRTRKSKTELFDHALPVVSRFKGVMNRHHLHSIPNILLEEEHALSPFVLALKPIFASPEELLGEEYIPSYSVDLLRGKVGSRARAESYDPTPFEAVDPLGDLSFSEEEIRNQLVEELVREKGWTRLSLPLRKDAAQAPKRMHASARTFLPEESKHFEIFSADTFVPSEPPEDIFTYFDLPEEESELESDIVTFDTIENSILELDEHEAEIENESTPPFRWHVAWLHPGSWQRAIVSFVILSFVIVLPLHAMNVVQELRETKKELTQTGETAVSLLSSGAHAALDRDASTAAASFAKATTQFDQASETINALGLGTSAILAALPVAGDDFRTGKALVQAGEELSIAGKRIAEGMQAAESELDPTPTSRLAILEIYLNSALPHLVLASDALSGIDADELPDAYNETFTTLQEQLPRLIISVEDFLSFYEAINVVLGGEGLMRYLLIFQNNTEIRPTGGFIGSFAELKVYDGVIEELTVPGGGSYDLQGSMRTKTAAPEPLQLLTSQWQFQDGNWFPDFPTSARQLLQFYEDAGGPTVDGVIAINATYVSNLIGLLGPVQMPDYDLIIDEENFIFEAQRVVEIEYDKEENRPKAFIGDLAPILMDMALEKTSEDFINLLAFAEEGLTTRDVQFYFSDDEIERLVLDRGWGGAVAQTDGDYLMVVNTNLGGGKTDGVIEEDVDVSIAIDENGSITNTVTITRTHHGIQGLLFTGVNNVDYLRLYTPKGSELISAKGFTIPDSSLFNQPEPGWEIDDDLVYAASTETVDPVSATTITQEHGKTVFGNWVQTKPGSSSTVTFTYKLPFTLEMLSSEPSFVEKLQGFIGIPSTDQYSLIIQKQSGVLDRTTNVNLSAPDSVTPMWSSHESDASFTNASDVFFATLFEEAQ